MKLANQLGGVSAKSPMTEFKYQHNRCWYKLTDKPVAVSGGSLTEKQKASQTEAIAPQITATTKDTNHTSRQGSPSRNEHSVSEQRMPSSPSDFKKSLNNAIEEQITDHGVVEQRVHLSFDYQQYKQEKLRQYAKDIQGQGLCERQSNTQKRVYQLQDLISFYDENTQLCQQQPESIELQDLINFCAYVRGDLRRKVVQVTMPDDYEFNLPCTGQVNTTDEKPQLTRGDFISEVAYLKYYPKRLGEIKKQLYRLRTKVMETLNKFTYSNLDILQSMIVLQIIEFLKTEPTSNYPKLIFFVFIDILVEKAGIEVKFQQQYFKLLSSVFSDEHIARLIQQNQYDRDIFISKTKSMETDEERIQRLQVTYSTNVCRNLLSTVLEEQIRYLTPRSRLLQIDDKKMTEDQQQYKRDLCEIYICGLCRFIAILTVNKYYTVERFMQFAYALLRYNYNIQHSDVAPNARKDIFQLDSITHDEPMGPFTNIGFDGAVFKYQTNLLYGILPELYYYADNAVTKLYNALLRDRKQPGRRSGNNAARKLSDDESSLQKYIISKFFNDDVHATFYRPSPELMKKQRDEITLDDVLAQHKHNQYYEMREKLIKLYEQYLVPCYDFLSARQQFEIDDLNYHIKTKFAKYRGNISTKMGFEAWKGLNTTIQAADSNRLTSVFNAKVQQLQEDKQLLEQFYAIFIESDVSSALYDVLGFQDQLRPSRQQLAQITQSICDYMINRQSVRRSILEQFFTQLIQVLAQCDGREVLKEYCLNTRFAQNIQLQNFQLMLVYIVKKKYVPLLDIMKYAGKDARVYINVVFAQLVCGEGCQILNADQSILSPQFRIEFSTQDTEDDVDYCDTLLEIANNDLYEVLRELLSLNREETSYTNMYSLLDKFQAGNAYTVLVDKNEDYTQHIEAARANKDVLYKIVGQLMDSPGRAEAFINDNRSLFQNTGLRDVIAIALRQYSCSFRRADVFIHAIELFVCNKLVSKREVVQYVSQQTLGPLSGLQSNSAWVQWAQGE